MNVVYLPSQSPTHLRHVLGSCWVSDSLHGATQGALKEGLMWETTAIADDVTAGRFPVQLPRSAPQGLGSPVGSKILVC